MKIPLYFATSCMALLFSCKAVEQHSSGPATTAAFAKEGWRPFSTARTGDGPGRIFRVEPGGTVFGVTSLSVPPHIDNQQTAALASNSSFSLDEILSTMGIAKEQLPANLQAKVGNKASANVQSIGGTREYLDDKDLPDSQLTSGLAGIKIRKDNTYYIIRETFSTDNIKYDIDKRFLSSIGVEAEVEQIIKTNTNMAFTKGQSVTMDAKFSKPYRIWYKAEKLKMSEPLGGAPGQPIKVSRIPGTDTSFIIPGEIVMSP